MTPAAREPVDVSVRDVAVAYDGVVAVRDASLDVAAGEVVALLGPSGCGKTSMLRAIAGLERPTSGSVSLAGRVVSDDRAWVAPERRQIGMVFQDGALFPHLTVAQNVAFGLGRDGARHPDRHDRVSELLGLVGLDGLDDRMPDTLSGGQRQRVALARSLAPAPGVLLLDEPFSALDAGLRVQVRSQVSQILREVGVTSIFVTHDQDEAFVMGDRVAVMRDTRIEQVGRPGELYRRPVNRWVAGFVGEANLVTGTRRNGSAETVLGSIPVDGDAEMAPSGADVAVLVRPEQIELFAGGSAEVLDVEYYGHDVRYVVRLGDGSTVAARALPDRLHDRGDLVDVRFHGGATVAWPA